MKTELHKLSLSILAGAILIATGSALPSLRSAEPVTRIARRPIRGHVLYDGSAMGFPTRLAVAHDRLIVLDTRGSQAVHILDTDTGGLIESFGSLGQGPGEFQGPRSIDVAPNGDEFWIYDLNQQRSTLFAVEPPTSATDGHRESRILTYSEGVGVIEPIHLGDHEILAAGMFDQGRLGHMDSDGRFIRASGALPSAPRGFQPQQGQFIYQGALRGTASRDRFALSSIIFTRVELFDRHGISRGFLKSPVELDPEIRRGRQGDRPFAFVSSEAPTGYVDIAVTDEAIYALYSWSRSG